MTIRILCASLATAVAFLSLVCPCCAEVVPTTKANALDGSVISFPSNDGQKPLLLMIGFSHKSDKGFDSWNRRFRGARLSDRVEYYQLVDFQGVPSFVMRMILHGMRRATPKEERSRVAPFYTGEKEWKQLTAYAAPEDAYLVLASSDGYVVWQTHGTASDGKFEELQTQILMLIARVRRK